MPPLPASVRSTAYTYLYPPARAGFARLQRLRPFEIATEYALSRLFPNSLLPLVESVRGEHSMESAWDTRATLNPLLVTGGEATEAETEQSAVADLDHKILRGIVVAPDAAVLEIGCGIGRLMKPFADRAGRVTGVDISPKMLELARERLAGRDNIALHKTDGTLAMIASDSIDLVYSFAVFHHLPEKRLAYRYVREAARVLKPGGVFRVQVDGRGYLWWRRSRAGTSRGIVFDARELEPRFRRQGLEVVSVEGRDQQQMFITAVKPGAAVARAAFVGRKAAAVPANGHARAAAERGGVGGPSS